MVKSLNELNLDIRKPGIRTVAVPEIRDLFSLINQDLEEIIHISLFINDTAKGSNKLLDLRSLGMLEDLKPFYNNSKIKEYVLSNFEGVDKFIQRRLQSEGDTLIQSNEITFIYFFGKIDQLKRDVMVKLDLIKTLIED